MADALGAALRHVRAVAAAHDRRDRSDGELLRAFVASDGTAFAALVKRHGPLVLGVCRRVLRHEQDAEDAFQATFLLLARRADSVRKCESLASWLHGVAYRMAKNMQRAAARRRGHERQSEPTPPRSPECEAAWREVQVVLDEEVLRLPAACREAFVLCCLENQTCAEAARRLGVKEGTVWSRLAAAKKRLRERLARRGVDLTAVLAAAALTHSASAVPKTLVSTVVKSAAAGGSTAGVVSATVATLVHGANRAMILSQVKTAVLLLLATGVVGLGVAARPPALAAFLPPADAGQRPPAARPAGLPADWSKTVEPDAVKDEAGQPIPADMKVKLWVEQGWLIVRRETAGGELEWQVVLARADDPRPPQIRADATGMIDVSYASYFVRESLGTLRVLRERKTRQSPGWPQIPADPLRKAGGFGGTGDPSRVTGWRVGDWYWVECGPAEDRSDIWLRVQHSDLLGEYGFVWMLNGPAQFNAPDGLLVQDEGDLMTAKRMLPREAAHKLSAMKIQQGIRGKPAPALDGREWFNTPEGLNMDKLRGKLVLLSFWDRGNGRCVDKLPRTEELHQKYKDRGLVVIGVHWEGDSGDLGEFLKQQNVTFPVMIDTGGMTNGVINLGVTAERYAIESGSRPRYFLIDKDGEVVWAYGQEPPTNRQIDELLK